MKRFILSVFAALAASLLYGGTLSTAGGTPVNYRKGVDENRRFMDFIGQLEAEASRAVKSAAPGNDGRVRIEVDKEEPAGHINLLRLGDSAVIVVGGDLDRYTDNRADARFFAAVFLLSRLNIPPERGVGVFPAFIADGICAGAEYAASHRAVLLNIARYPGVRSVISSGGKFNLRRALKGGVIRDDGAPGAFYDETARLGLDILTAGVTPKRNPVAVMVRELASTGDFDGAFNAAFGPLVGAAAVAAVSESDVADARLERLIRRRVFSMYVPYCAAEQASMLADIRKCVYYEEESDEPKQADLADLPLLIEQRVDSCRIVLNNKQRALVELIAGAGPVTVGDLEKVLKAIGRVGDIPGGECSAQLAGALSGSEAAIALLAAIERELDDAENALVPEQQRFPWRFSVVKRDETALPSGVSAELDRMNEILAKP
ncbi:MAG: hypothetical protein PHI85_07360 [Victivallaceae bacterium]|nr:hypothetical protein [Victivallaceae bacterium]